MTTTSYASDRTGLLLVDPYNDFLSEGGKLWPLVKPIAEEHRLLDNLRKIVAAARAAGLQLFIVPHHRAEPNDYASWKYRTPIKSPAARCRLSLKTPGAESGIPISFPSPRTSSLKSTGRAEYCLAMEFSATSEDVARTGHPHPTRSEASRQAAMGVDGWAMQA